MSRHAANSSLIIGSRGNLFPENTMLRRADGAIATVWLGILVAVRARPIAFLTISGAVLALNVILPPLVLAVTRKPWTYFTFNPWLKKLPEYVVSGETLEKKLDFLSRVALYWFTADGPYGAPEWGFAVDTMDVLRFVVMALLVGAYGALWLYARQRGQVSGWHASATKSGGVVGEFARGLGFLTWPSSVVNWIAVVQEVVGVVFRC